MSVAAIFVFDGFADHEVTLATTWLRTHAGYIIETFSGDGKPVTSMSGLKVRPDTSLKKTDPEYFDLLILPGGEKWEKGDNLEIFPLIMKTVGVRPVAAICGATLALADLGLLDDILHTSNFPAYIPMFCPDYKGTGLYRTVPCVNAGNIITANGIAIIDFAYEVLKASGGFDAQKARDWRELYLSGGEVQSFFNTLQPI